MKKSLFILLALCSSLVRSQIITTIAGNGVAGYSGDGGQATDAEIWSPSGVFVDKTGNIYISDGLNNRIRKVNTAGIITTIAGNGYNPGGHGGYSGDGGPATDAELSNPQSICTDSLGNLYIADALNNRIRKVDTTGIISTIAGNGHGGFSGDGGAATACEIWEPLSIFIDTKGNMFISDAGNYRVRKINAAGLITTVVGGGRNSIIDDVPATSVSFYSTAGVFVNDSGNIYVSTYGPSQVFKVDKMGYMYIVAGIGINGYSGDGGAATAAELYEPAGICIDTYSNVYIGDLSNNRVRKINYSTGIITTVAGDSAGGYSGDGGPATDAELGGPNDVFVDAFNNMYIADYYNYRVRKVTDITGIISINNSIDFTIFPNPTPKILTLNFNKQITGLATLSVMDITGREVLTYPFLKTKEIQIDVSSLASGIYLINIKNKEISLTQKFIKQ